MQKDNIVKFDPKRKKIIYDKTLFSNAELVDIEHDTSHLVDILVCDGKVVEINECGSKTYENVQEYNLDGDYVLPCFYDAYRDNSKLFGNNVDEKILPVYRELMSLKDVLSGVCTFYDKFSGFCIENFEDFEEENLNEISNLAAMTNNQIALKVGQDLDTLGQVYKKYGKDPAFVLEDFGILDRLWRLVGGNCLEKDDLETFLKYGNFFVVCPQDDAQNGRRPANLKTLSHMGFELFIGSGSAFEIDFFAYMRQILNTQWGLLEDKDFITEKDVLLMATAKVPTLQVGSNASFIVLRRSHPSLYPNLLKEIVWGFSKADVEMTVFNGNILQKDGFTLSGISGLDYLGLVEKIEKLKGENENDNN